MTVARKTDARISEAVAMGTWRELKRELARGEEIPDPTITDFSETYLREYCETRNRRPDFKHQAMVSINSILGHVKLSQFRRADAHRFVSVRSKQVGPATVNRGLAVLKNMLSFAVDKEILDSHPLTRFKMTPEPRRALRVLTFEQYRKLVRAVAVVDPVLGVYTAVLGETGLRKSEGLALLWSDIDAGRGLLTVRESKGGRPRYVPLTQFALEQLGSLVRVIGRPEVFIRLGTGKPWKDPRGPFKKGCEKAKLDWVKGFHDLRHFRATQWLINGVDVRTVQELLGHRDINTTLRYVHYVQEHAVKSVRRAERSEIGGRKVDGEA